ncbi:hypothetical protein GCM10010985_59670 [Caballeronia grimmiae]|uniref:Lipoprotein n=1 Tax=Caballeronia grimmiae TaxID=1071679 RepID=A0ABQ1S7G4_9BURK|nr:hypothetical protein GCM10010985_59670 [Caballeronia grimmiae]
MQPKLLLVKALVAAAYAIDCNAASAQIEASGLRQGSTLAEQSGLNQQRTSYSSKSRSRAIDDAEARNRRVVENVIGIAAAHWRETTENK